MRAGKSVSSTLIHLEDRWTYEGPCSLVCVEHAAGVRFDLGERADRSFLTHVRQKV
jgi:hypothetical protein